MTAGGDPLLAGMLRVALENGLGTLMFVVGGVALIVGLSMMLLTGDEGRLGRFGNGFLFLGIGFSMYPIFNIMAFVIEDGRPIDLPSWLLTAPAIAGPAICAPIAWLSFRAARDATAKENASG